MFVRNRVRYNQVSLYSKFRFVVIHWTFRVGMTVLKLSNRFLSISEKSIIFSTSSHTLDRRWQSHHIINENFGITTRENISTLWQYFTLLQFTIKTSWTLSYLYFTLTSYSLTNPGPTIVQPLTFYLFYILCQFLRKFGSAKPVCYILIYIGQSYFFGVA